MLFPKKIPDMPKWNWKKDLKFWANFQSTKKEPKPLKRSPLPPSTKPIAKIGKRKIERIKNEGSETDIFMTIWNNRPHICENCWQTLNEPKTHNFDHIIPKSRWKEYRLDEDNIQIVCFACHYEKTTWQIYKWINLD